MQNIPKWSFLVGEPMVVGYQHFRKPPYQSHLAWTAFCNRCLVAPCSLWWQADSKELLESVEPLEKLGVNGPSVLHYGFRQSPIWAWFTTMYIYIYPLYIFVSLCISLYQARSMYDCMLLWEDIFPFSSRNIPSGQCTSIEGLIGLLVKRFQMIKKAATVQNVETDSEISVGIHGFMSTYWLVAQHHRLWMRYEIYRYVILVHWNRIVCT